MSSLKMTFSLTSLIFLIALGLVFVPTSVMAHEAGSDERVHPHPLREGLDALDGNADNDTNDPGEAAVTAHTGHPTVTSVVLKQGDAVRGNMAVITADDATTTDVNEHGLTLIVTFSEPVNTSDGTAVTVTATDLLAATALQVQVRNANNVIVAGTPATVAGTAGDVTRVADNDMAFEVPVTFDAAAIPNGTMDDPLESLTFYVRVNAGVAFALAQPAGINPNTPGGANYQQSSASEFMLVHELPMEDDTTPPTVAITVADDLDAMGKAVFTLTFSEALGTGLGALTVSDIEITGGTAMAADLTGPAEGNVYTLKVTPTDANTSVTIALRANSVADAAGNPLATMDAMGKAVETTMAVYDKTAPTVTITSVAGEDDDAGKIIFTIDFSEAPGMDADGLSIADLRVSNAGPLKVADLMMVEGTTDAPLPDGVAMRYTLTVTPTDATMPSMIDLAAGSVADMSGNMADGVRHTYTPSDATTTPADAAGLATGDTRDTITSEAEFALSGMLKPGDFAVFSPMDDMPIEGAVGITGFPNLQRFFARGGTISLIGGTSDAGKINKSVVITEIMWGLNTAAAIGSQADYQWIEVYNTDNVNANGKGTATPATVDLKTYKLVFTPGKELPQPANLSDQISNIELGGWTVDVGQSGSLGTASATFSPVNMISMYRNIVYANVTKVHNKDDAAKNRDGQLGAIPDGNVKGNWKASTGSDTYAANQLGSPGEMHFIGRTEADVIAGFTPSNVGRTATVISEVGNNSNDAYDWVELTAIADTNLKDYELQYIEAQNVTVLAHFHDKVLKAGEILLVLQSNPRNNPDHPVAAGKEWKVADADRDNTGTASLYHVHGNLKIPNDKGKALFVLRSAKGKKNHENIVDLAGNSFVTDETDAYRTNLWPLRATKAGHGNVIDGDVEDFNSGRVYQRNDRSDGTGEKDWSIRGYTGIGYKRSASKNNQNGGTPGFDNGAQKEKSSDLADGSVSISEIMYDRGDRSNLTQWIELHNGSATQAVNLNEWKLKIESADDVDIRTPSVTIANLGGTIIPPNQTILIVAYTTGRVSRGSQGGIDFPATRVISVSGKGELEIPADVNKRNYRLLSNTSFKLTLMEKGGGMVDTVGNMGATEAWDLPMAENGEGRSSVIRRYDAGMAQDGTMGSSWVLAATSDLAEVRVNETYYGHPDDAGTPGYRGGGALPVSLSKFRPERMKDTGEIVVRWITESELNNAGFNILRSEKRDSDFTKVHFEAGEGTTSERQVYEWKDTTAKPNVVYYYQIQDVSLDGEVTTLRTTHLRGNVTAVGKATTTWGEIKALQ